MHSKNQCYVQKNGSYHVTDQMGNVATNSNTVSYFIVLFKFSHTFHGYINNDNETNQFYIILRKTNIWQKNDSWRAILFEQSLNRFIKLRCAISFIGICNTNEQQQ